LRVVGGVVVEVVVVEVDVDVDVATAALTGLASLFVHADAPTRSTHSHTQRVRGAAVDRIRTESMAEESHRE
jgi:hypothetical protein